ncbi:BTAD domain-containing putative transcriptional regulator [Micromonospora sp. CPCC 205711]|uniref:AfsR/SARP family transcriptional regulator n=1 Tax=Micromonospora sp. CPCC 205547 TaxID=3122400 RepID=UPI002FF172CA
MRISLLGPLEVHADTGSPAEVGGARLRRLLILLALEPGRWVPVPRLVDRLWGDQPPAGAANALQALVSRLRRAVPGLPVEAGPGGYRLAVGRDAVDLHRFETMTAAGRALLPDDPARAADRLAEALALWRGPALADVAGDDFARGPVARLGELRLAATEDLIEARLAVEDPSVLVPELCELVAAHPLRERLTGQLMRALHATGRSAEALAGYERLRSTLARTLGTDPGPELTALHLAVLRGEHPAGHHPGRPAPPRATPADAPPAGTAPVAGTVAAAGAATPAGVTTVAGAATQAGVAGVAGAATPAGATGIADSGGAVGAAGQRRRSAPDPAGPAPLGRNNLPAGLTSFVGREDALDQVRDLLTRTRLATLTGPGGAGKTRLAVESGRGVVDLFPDGVWLVELAPVTDPAEVAQTVLAALGLREQALFARARVPAAGEVTDPMARLAGALAHRTALLVLDNCEHLLDAAAGLVDRLLATCPDLRVLATSREPLGITGEAIHPVGSLALPPPDATPPVALAYPAVRLLADRAAAARPDFTVDATTVGPVVRICRALDGMPLAIELAAARLRAMTAGQVAARLDDRFRLLTGGSRTALPRHQTLRAVVDWSWELLPEGERALWRRMSVFAGGATLETVERVCAGTDLAPADVLDRLSALVEKSLVLTVGDAEPRYRMLETIREYGRDRLVEAGEADPVRRAHTAEFLSLAERADRELRGRDQLRWLGRIAVEQDNLHAALRWAIGTGDAATAVRFAAALGSYWWLRGQRAEGADLAEEVLALADEQGLPATPALAVAYAVGSMNVLSARADLSLSQRWLRRGAVLAAGLDDASPFLRLVGPMAAMSDVRDPRAGFAAISRLFADRDPWVGGAARLMHAHMELNTGGPPASARARFAEALELFGSVGERWGLSTTRFSLADLITRDGDHRGAVAHLQRAVDDVRDLGAAEDLPQMQARLAHEYWLLGERDDALALLAEAQREAERVGADEALAGVAATYCEVLRDREDWAGAAWWAGRVERLTGARHVVPQWRAMIATGLGHVAVGQGDLPAGRAYLDRGLDLAVESMDAPVVAIVVIGYADYALRAGRPGAAARLLGGADGIRGGDDRSALDALRVARAARATLGEAEFAEAYAGGREARLGSARELVRVTLDA